MTTADLPPLDFITQAPFKMLFTDTLDCAPERAFAVLADVGTWQHWFDTCKSCEWNTKAPHGVGAERTIHLRGMDVTERILAFEPGQRFSFVVTRNTSGVTKRMVEDMRLTAIDGHTRVDWTVAYEPSLLLKIVHPLGRMVFSRMFRRSLAGLKRFTRPS